MLGFLFIGAIRDGSAIVFVKLTTTNRNAGILYVLIATLCARGSPPIAAVILAPRDACHGVPLFDVLFLNNDGA
jgi:hypothetical protein